MKKSLFQSIVLAFICFAVALVLLMGCFVFLGMGFLEDHLFTNELNRAVADYLTRKKYNNIVQMAPGLFIYSDLALLPAPLRKKSEVFAYTGYHEIHLHTETEEHFFIEEGLDKEFHIFHGTRANGKPFYAVYETTGVELTQIYSNLLLKILLYSAVCTALAGAVIGVLLARRITQPLARLTRAIRGSETLPNHLATPGVDSEISQLSRAMEEANQRINAFLLREKEFTRNASHELRTPLTVVKGAAELLQARLGADSLPLQRILRSVSSMEQTIATFLLLAREDTFPDEGMVDLGFICRQALDQAEALSRNPSVEFFFEEKAAVSQVAPAAVVEIALLNLLRNSIQNIEQGRISLRLEANAISVSDTGRGIDAQLLPHIRKPGVKNEKRGNTGFGLSIVERICQRIGWRMEIESFAGEGTVVRLIFHEN